MDRPYRVAVTGSRGKSGVVRLIHAGFCACGLKAYARITGVLPRELNPLGERPILRPSGANVSEMKWWLKTLPADVEAIVMENSAVSPELQELCPLWLRPQVTVLTNIRPDHESFWGSGEGNVLRALSGGLPRGKQVVVPEALAPMPALRYLAERKNLKILPAEAVTGLPVFLSLNVGLALEACAAFGLDRERCLEAMRALPPDFADFAILSIGEGRLAFAFSANDVATTEDLFQSTGWNREDVAVLFNHRSDRIDRFCAFEGWMARHPWREVLIIGDRPPRTALKCGYFNCDSVGQLARRIGSGLWMGCGNAVFGLPLPLKLACEEGGLAL
ncbi:MAG: Mur ligase family protein [Pyramidobacter sp.]